MTVIRGKRRNSSVGHKPNRLRVRPTSAARKRRSRTYSSQSTTSRRSAAASRGGSARCSASWAWLVAKLAYRSSRLPRYAAGARFAPCPASGWTSPPRPGWMSGRPVARDGAPADDAGVEFGGVAGQLEGAHEEERCDERDPLGGSAVEHLEREDGEAEELGVRFVLPHEVGGDLQHERRGGEALRVDRRRGNASRTVAVVQVVQPLAAAAREADAVQAPRSTGPWKLFESRFAPFATALDRPEVRGQKMHDGRRLGVGRDAHEERVRWRVRGAPPVRSRLLRRCRASPRRPDYPPTRTPGRPSP